MPNRYKVFRGSLVANVGQPYVIRATIPHGEHLTTVEWYLMVRTHQDKFGYRLKGTLTVDTEVNADDPMNPIALSPEFAESDVMEKVQHAFAVYRATCSKEPMQSQQFPDVEFQECSKDVLAALLIGGAGRSEFESIRSMTRSNELKHDLFTILATVSEKKRDTSNPYGDPGQV